MFGVLRVPPPEAYYLTPRNIDAMLRGREQVRRESWAQTLRITGMWGDKETVDSLFGSGTSEKRIMSREEFEAFKAEMGAK